MARRPAQIDGEQVCKLAALGATGEEIANFFGVDRATIHRRFATEIEKGTSMLKIKLRRLQIRAAERGSVSMLIFLGKVMLGQKEGAGMQHREIQVIFGSDDEEQLDDPVQARDDGGIGSGQGAPGRSAPDRP